MWPTDLPERGRARSLRRNPRPPGHIDPQGATAALLLALDALWPRWAARHEVCLAARRCTGSSKSVAWALDYARRMGWVEATGDARNARYMRYRITALGRRCFA